jgi:hypothetical protein
MNVPREATPKTRVLTAAEIRWAIKLLERRGLVAKETAMAAVKR